MSDHNDKKYRAELDSDAFEKEVASDLDEETRDKPKGVPLHYKILAGLAVGIIAGIAVNKGVGGDDPKVVWITENITQPVGQLFLRLLLMIVVPLVFSSLIVGIAGIGDIRKLGRVGLKSFGYCLVISAISAVLGLTIANTIKPGKRIDPVVSAQLQERYGGEARKDVASTQQTAGVSDTPLMQVVKTIVPSNPIA